MTGFGVQSINLFGVQSINLMASQYNFVYKKSWSLSKVVLADYILYSSYNCRFWYGGGMQQDNHNQYWAKNIGREWWSCQHHSLSYTCLLDGAKWVTVSENLISQVRTWEKNFKKICKHNPRVVNKTGKPWLKSIMYGWSTSYGFLYIIWMFEHMKQSEFIAHCIIQIIKTIQS